uniref:Uncharacterized protein n=1 Tax=Medicago truncatula TaxID=3880 RepID=Q2HS26_MEDTR|nr:hypothetical protein MtrDRAFT_AC157503g23v2 [Medicago truncatula]
MVFTFLLSLASSLRPNLLYHSYTVIINFSTLYKDASMDHGNVRNLVSSELSSRDELCFY